MELVHRRKTFARGLPVSRSDVGGWLVLDGETPGFPGAVSMFDDETGDVSMGAFE